MRLFPFILFLVFYPFSSVKGADTTTYFNQYTCTTSSSSTTVAGVNDATYLASNLDTTLYLGNTVTLTFNPTVNADFGLLFEGSEYALIKASGTYSLYSNELRSSGSTITFWVYIMDAQRDQIFACKQNSQGSNDVGDKLCFGMANGYFYGKVYNETLFFDVDVQEGWNFLSFSLLQDSTNTYTRMRVVSYSRARAGVSYKTFSFVYYDDPDYDMIIGGKFSNDGLNLTKGFTGYILEIRLYSTDLMTMEELDQQIDWDCTTNTAQKLCEFCPMYVSSTANICLEDLSTSRTTPVTYMLAKYSFTGAPSGTGRQYYRSTINSVNYDFYFGNASPDVRMTEYEPHRSEANGLYFDGNDYISQTKTGTIMTFGNKFTVELWCRFTEKNISQNYYLFQKIHTFGKDYPFFQFYFATNRSFIIEMNKTQVLDLPETYNNETFPDKWVFIGVSYKTLYYNDDKYLYKSKSCVYIWGPNNYEKYGCGIIDDYYDETTDKPNYFDTKMGRGYIGFIRSVYIWDFYKAMSSLYYSPRRNFPKKDRCSPFANQGYPYCSACDQYLGSSTCFSSCYSNSYSSSYNFCFNRNCTNDQCITCYYDASAFGNNYCTACIPNAFITSGKLGNCKCKDGYYLDEVLNQCVKCDKSCKTCFGPGNGKCYECSKGFPEWQGMCLNNCGDIGEPYNNTYTYSEKLNTCVSCSDFYYSTNWQSCTAQPYPMTLTNYNNQYMIVKFSSQVKYEGKKIDEIFSLSIDGPNQPYDFNWSVPYWESNQYQKDVFIELKISSILKGNEKIYLYMDNIFISDSRGFLLLARNSTSKSEFLPLTAKLIQQDYISDGEKALLTTADYELYPHPQSQFSKQCKTNVQLFKDCKL